MKFDEVLRDLAQHVIEEANAKFLIQHAGHDFKPFMCQRQSLSAGGHVFTVKIEFEPEPMEAFMLRVAKN